MAGGGGGGGGGGGSNPIMDLLKPMMTGKDDPMGMLPKSQPPAGPLRPMTPNTGVAPVQETDRLAFMRAFGVQG